MKEYDRIKAAARKYQDREDIAQQAFEIWLRRQASAKARGVECQFHPDTLCVDAMRMLHKDNRRRKAPTIEELTDQNTPQIEPELDEAMHSKALKAKLSAASKALLELRAYGYSMSNIAKAIGVSAASLSQLTAEMRRFTASKKRRALWKAATKRYRAKKKRVQKPWKPKTPQQKLQVKAKQLRYRTSEAGRAYRKNYYLNNKEKFLEYARKSKLKKRQAKAVEHGKD